MEAEVHAYTDGSALDFKYGGIGVYFANPELQMFNVSKPFYARPITNNRTELYAVITAIDVLMTHLLVESGKWGRGRWRVHLTIHSDSMYVINSMTKWAGTWEKRGWRKADGEPVENMDLIFYLYKLEQFHRRHLKLTYRHVKAHRERAPRRGTQAYADWVGNREADALAKRGTTAAIRANENLRD